MTDPRLLVWTYPIDVDPEELELLVRLLTRDERDRASRFVVDRDRRRFVAARGRLRMILGAELGVSAASIAFRYGRKGKPSLAAPFDRSRLRFSLSHSAGLALVGVTRGREVGCDLEKVRAVRYGPAVARRFFSPEENAVLDRLEGSDWNEAFFRCWTLKESFIKALGDGLSYPTRRFTVSWGEGGERLVRLDDDPAAAGQWTVGALDAPAGFHAAFTVRGAAPDVEVRGRVSE